MTKFRALLAAIASVVFLSLTLVAPITPAQATTGYTCKYYGPTNSWRVCMSVTVNKQTDGTGSVLKGVSIYCGPENAFESPATHGKSLVVKRPDGGILFERKYDNANIPGDCHQSWSPTVKFPGNYAFGVYTYKARLDNWPDADNQAIDLTVYN